MTHSEEGRETSQARPEEGQSQGSGPYAERDQGEVGKHGEQGGEQRSAATRRRDSGRK